MADEAKLHSPIHSDLKHWLCKVLPGIVMEKNWVLSADQYHLQAVQFSVHLIDLLNILLRCNGFTEIQKAVVDQTSSRLLDSDHDLFFFFGASLALRSVLELYLGPATELVVAGCHIKCTFHCISNPIEKWFVVT